MTQIRIAIVGVGNCASSLVQGLRYYAEPSRSGEGAGSAAIPGLMRAQIGRYRTQDISVAAAFDVDLRKVGKDVSEAIFAPPNNTTVFEPDVPKSGVRVHRGRVFDGVPEHMADYPERRRFLVGDEPEPSQADVVRVLRETRSEVLVNFLPVGSEQATRFYVDCALEAGCAVVNCIPVFVASRPELAARFDAAGLPIVGDDIKAQLGAMITHRTLTDLFAQRGVPLDRTYQLNTGGNTDFLNMLNRSRLTSKKISKTEAVQSVAAAPLDEGDIHVGPSDYVAWQKDNKVCFLRMEGRLFGDVPMHLEMRLSVEDSPNSAGVVVDAIRCARLALDRGISGPLEGPSAAFMKHPPRQLRDEEARLRTEAFIDDA